MFLSRYITVALLAATWVVGEPVARGQCFEHEACTEPCPAANSCHDQADCPAGMVCVPSCLPSLCSCDTANGWWNCSFDCAGACREPVIPHDPPRYVIIDLGTLGGGTSVGLGINEAGQVVGGADTPQGRRHAFLWDAGVMTDIGAVLPTSQSEANDINNLGQVVGLASGTGDPAFAFLWDDGEVTLLGERLVPKTAYAINDAGQVVGVFIAAFDYHPFLWENGVITDLKETYGGVGTIAWDINTNGQVIGGPSLWNSDGTVTTLQTLGGEITQGFGLNDYAQVVGWSERAPGSRRFRAFLWDNGKMVDLHELAGFAENVGSRAWAINNDGRVVGTGFLYHPDTGIQDPEELLPFKSGWFSISTRDINDAGQIVGAGTFYGHRHAFLMTPIDADFDDDKDRDLDDFDSLRSCMSGPGAAVEPLCKPCDINRDGRVDLRDFRAFEWVFMRP